MLWQMSNLTVQIHVTSHFLSLPKYLTNCGYTGKSIDYFSFDLASCLPPLS